MLQEVGRTSKVGWVGSTENRGGGVRYKKDPIKMKKGWGGAEKRDKSKLFKEAGLAVKVEARGRGRQGGGRSEDREKSRAQT